MKTRSTITAFVASSLLATSLHAVPCDDCYWQYTADYWSAQFALADHYSYCENTWQPGDPPNPFIVAMLDGCKDAGLSDYNQAIHQAAYDLGACEATCC